MGTPITEVPDVPDVPDVPIHIKLQNLSDELQKLNYQQRIRLGVQSQMLIIDLSKPLDIQTLYGIVTQSKSMSWSTLRNLSLLSTVFEEKHIVKDVISNPQAVVLTNIEQFWERTLCKSMMTVDRCDIDSNETISFASPYDISQDGRIDMVQESETVTASVEKRRTSVHVPSLYFLKAYHTFLKTEHPTCKTVEKRILQELEKFTGVKRSRMILRRGAKKKRTDCLVLPHMGILHKQWRSYVKQKYPDLKDEWKFKMN
jgi:hypothetical protein